MNDGELLTYMGVDGQRWAEKFCEMHGGDIGLMLGWFANAIEAGKQAAREELEKV